MNTIQGYVINLESRPDRWQDCLKQSSAFPFQLNRVPAISAHEIAAEEPFVPGGVAATWRSHQRAMSYFLNSKSSHALILEDDFLVKRDISKIINLVVSSDDFDLVQIGFLSPSLTRTFIRYLFGMRDLVLKLLFRLTSLFRERLSNKLLVREQSGVSFAFVLNDIQAGGHAYIVSRKFCEAAQLMNNPSFLSADGVLMALSETRTFRVARTRRNYIKQSDSESSVHERFKRAS